MQIFHLFNLSVYQWLWVILAVFLIGFSKTDISSFITHAIAVGALLGVLIIKKLNEKLFHRIIIVVTAIAAIRLLI